MRDVDTCLRDGRTALISVGYGEGPTRMSDAMKNALHSPLLCDTDIMSAKELLFAFYYSHDIQPPFKVSETIEANALVAQINKRVHIKFGWGYDETLGNKIKFTILASGFDVSVDTGGSVTVIEGRKPEESVEAPEVPQAVIDAYGKDKIDDLIRQQETQNYYILSPEQLDSDEAIEMVERTPAFKRDKRKASMAHAPAEAPAQQPAPQTQRRQDFNHISFSADDK